MSDRNEFIAIGWVGVVAIFAAGFMLAEALEDLRNGTPAAGLVFLAIMFAIMARSDAKGSLESGMYRRKLFTFKREPSP